MIMLLAACQSSDDSQPPATTTGCDGASLLPIPSDTAARGPWAVGVRTVQVGELRTEVWYPAAPGSDAGKETARYDIRMALPPAEAAKIPDDDNPWQTCDCYRELPLDETHGPYPVVVFVHGTASFRHQSLSIVTHWASRGFVVVAADHPGLFLADLLTMACGGTPPAQHLDTDVAALVSAVGTPSGDLAFLAGHVASTHIGLAGHSAGAGAAASGSALPGVRAVVSLAGAQSTTMAGPTSIFIGGMDDGIAPWNRVLNAWTGSPPTKYLVGIDKARHLSFSDLCSTQNAEGQNLLEIAKEHDVCGAMLAGFLFDCDPGQIDFQRGWQIINATSTAVLESTLQCRDAAIEPIAHTFTEVSQYREEP
jgi:predicted dienelactone hydrolase